MRSPRSPRQDGSHAGCVRCPDTIPGALQTTRAVACLLPAWAPPGKMALCQPTGHLALQPQQGKTEEHGDGESSSRLC